MLRHTTGASRLGPLDRHKLVLHVDGASPYLTLHHLVVRL